MKTDLRNLLAQQDKQKYATDAGTLMHSKLQRVIIDTDTERGDKDLIQKIKSQNDTLSKFFQKTVRTEVPVAGRISGKIISRRIDRLLVNTNEKIVQFLDYKTDLNKTAFRDKYVFQMKEYTMILHDIYPDYSISGFILWLHDWDLEKII